MFKIRLHSSNSGFTIVELVAVIVVLGIALAPFGVMFSHVMIKHAQVEAIQIASVLAEVKMEEVTGTRFLAIDDEVPTAFEDFPNYTYEIIVTTISGESTTDEYKQVEVQVVNSLVDVNVNLVTIVTIKENVA
ncbi:type II secretion system protein [Candidatus Omnitrophota bacterium]